MTDLSTCCGAPVKMQPEHKLDLRGVTCFYQCTKCGKRCDVAHEFPDPHWDEACVKCGGFDGEPCEPPREHTSNRGNSVLLSFIAQGRAGRSCVYATPEGNFLSPEAVRRKVEAAKREAKIEAECEALGLVRKKVATLNWEPTAADYDTAIDDIVSSLKQQ